MRCFNIFGELLILAGLNVVQAAWVLSAKGASCDASCASGETCDAERMQLISSEEAMALAVTSGGVRACAVYVADDDSLDTAQPYQLDDYITGLTGLPVLCFVNGVNSTCAASGAQLQRLCCCYSGSGNVADQCPTPTTTSSTTTSSTATVTTLTSTIVTTTSSTATTRSTVTTTGTTSRTTLTTSVTTTTLTTTTVSTTTLTTVTVTTVTATATSMTSSTSKTLTESTSVTTKTATSTSQTTATSTTSITSSVTTSSTTATSTTSITSSVTTSSTTATGTTTTTQSATSTTSITSSVTTSSTTATVTTSTSSSVTATTSTSSSVTTSSTTATVTTSTSSSVTTSSTTVTVTTSTSSSVTVTTSTSSSVTVTTSTSSSVTVTTSTSSSVTATTSTSSSVTSTSTTSRSSTSSTTTMSSSTTKSSSTSTTLLQRMVVPSNVDPDQPEGAVVLAALEGALAATNADQDAIVLSTDAGKVSVVKLSSSADPSSSLVFEVDLDGQQTSNGTIAVSVPMSLILQLEEGGNVMLVVTQITQDLTESLSDSDAGTAILSGPMLEISLVKEQSGEVSVSNVSNLTDPVVFRLGDATPHNGDVCVFFDVDANSWSSEGMSVASSDQIADVGALTSGTWCVATHLSLFSIAHTVPFNDVLEPKDYLLSAEDYMIAVGLMLAFCIPVCAMVCVWFCFRFCKAANSGKTSIKDNRGRSHVVKFTRSEVGVKGEVKKKQWMAKSLSNLSGNSQPKKVVVTWEVEPAEMLASLDHMEGHGRVAMDVAVGPRMTEKKSTKSLKDLQSPTVETVSKELRKASQQDDQMEEMREEELARLEEEEEIVEVSLDHFQVWELYKDREAVNYWSATHQTWMQAFVAGRATWDENNQPYYNVLVGPRKQRREQVSCSMLCPAFKDGESIFYDEGDETERSWSKGVVAQVLHAKAIVQAHNLEGSGEKPKDVPFSRVCRRYENDTTVLVYRGKDVGWQTALVAKVQDFDGRSRFSPFEVTAIQVFFASGTDPVTVQTCFVQNSKENESFGTEHFPTFHVQHVM